MKRILSIIAVVVLTMFALATPVFAVVKSNDFITVAKDEVIDDDFFASGQEVIIEGTVNGDVYVAASRVAIRGTVNGDVLAAASSIEVSGTIADDLRAGANTITLVGATIGDSVSVGGNELSADSATTIGGGLLFGGRLLSIDATVGRGITSGNQTTRIDGEVGRTVRVAAESITVGENAVIDGDFEYRSDVEATINGSVSGNVIQGEGADLNAEAVLRGVVVAFNIWAFIAALLVGAVMIWLFPSMFKKAHERFTRQPARMSGWAAIFLFAIPPLAVILFVSFLGIPLAFTVLLVWGLFILFAKFFVGYSVGYSLLKWLNRDDKYSPGTFWALALGLTLYYLLRMLPVVGIFVRLATTIAGVALILTLYKRPRAATKK